MKKARSSLIIMTNLLMRDLSPTRVSLKSIINPEKDRIIWPINLRIIQLDRPCSHNCL